MTAGVGNRVANALARAGYTTVEQVEALSDDELLVLPNVGPEGLRAIRRLIPEPPRREPLPRPEPPISPVQGVTVTVHDRAGNVLASE